MRIVMRRQPLTRVLKWGQRVFFGCAVLTLGYCGFVLLDTWTFQNRESRDLESRLHDQSTASGIKVRNPLSNSTPDLFAVATGGLIGRLEIPRLGLSVIVIEGEDQTTLRRAAGHVPGTPLPGQLGNVGVTAHRDTFFRPLRNIQRNDMITLTTLQGEYRYRVVSTRVVSPDDFAVLDSTGGEFLTLVTCHPFYFVGPAPNRFIVRAERVTGAVI
jgi:sortase A